MPSAENKNQLNLPRIEQAFLSKHHVWEFWSAQNCPPRLQVCLETALPHIASSTWAARFRWGGVFVNGHPQANDCALQAPCRIEYYEPKFNLESAREFFPAWHSSYILFQDDDVLVVFKPNKLSSVPSRDQSDFNLKSYLEAHLGKRVHMPSRLDLSTAGLTLVCLNPSINKTIQKMFERRNLSKYYLLQVGQSPEWQTMQVDADIGKDKRHPVLRKVVKERGKQACTEFFNLGLPQGAFLVAKPRSGRTHQIRVHAQFLGLPIKGDNFYGGEEADCLHLLSYRLKFPHPRGNKIIDVILPKELAPAWCSSTLPFALGIG